jgi:hypothetical protein
MPRKSAQALRVTAVPSARIEPPPDLTDEQREDWRVITAKFPPDHFGADNAPLLAQLVTHLSLARQLAEQLAGLRKTTLTATTARGAQQRAAFCQLLRMHAQESRLIASLSVKLRLTNSSHRNDRYDERRLRTTPDGPRPWEQH